MLLVQDKNITGNIIRSYAPGSLVVNEATYHHSILLTPQVLIENWPPQDITQLQSRDLRMLVEQNPEVIILGTGKQQYFPPTETLAVLIEHNIGFEIMDTASACRTYNLLMAEDRKVAAGLIIA